MDGSGTDGTGADHDTPDELLTDEKNSSSDAGAGDSVLTTGTFALGNESTPSTEENEGQREDSFPQSGVYESFTWKVEEIRPEEDPAEQPLNICRR